LVIMAATPTPTPTTRDVALLAAQLEVLEARAAAEEATLQALLAALGGPSATTEHGPPAPSLPSSSASRGLGLDRPEMTVDECTVVAGMLAEAGGPQARWRRRPVGGCTCGHARTSVAHSPCAGPGVLETVADLHRLTCRQLGTIGDPARLVPTVTLEGLLRTALPAWLLDLLPYAAEQEAAAQLLGPRLVDVNNVGVLRASLGFHLEADWQRLLSIVTHAASHPPAGP
jgi:hypothetical protein